MAYKMRQEGSSTARTSIDVPDTNGVQISMVTIDPGERELGIRIERPVGDQSTIGTRVGDDSSDEVAVRVAHITTGNHSQRKLA